MASTIMFIGAHHDDNELMAGTIAKHRAAGWRVVSVVMTNGRWTPAGVNEANVEMRNNESRDAARLLDMEPVFFGFQEANFCNNVESRKAVVETLREYQPNVVVVHPPQDYHGDHMETSKCVTDAVYRSGGNSFDAGGKPWGSMMLYYCDAWAMPFEPDVYVDVSEHIQLKRDALACHKSQIGPDGPARGDMIDIEETRARNRGFQSGCDYAEAFRLAPRPGAVRKAELLT